MLGGLWHGASWNFVIWGAIHGGWLGVERVQGKDSFYRHLPRPFQVVVTFMIVCIAWVFFRASDLPAALSYLGSMFGLAPVGSPGAALIEGVILDPYYVTMVALATGIAFFAPQSWDWTRRITWLKALLCLLGFSLALILLEMQTYNPFISFIF